MWHLIKQRHLLRQKRLFLANKGALPLKAPGGFSLIEAAIALLLLGLLSAGLLSFLEHLKQRTYTQKTAAHQERIFRALGNFLRQNGCLPCPADPMEKQLFGHARKSCRSEPDAQGLVPFRTLGLSEKVAQNGASVFFTYVVHPTITQRPPAGPKNVHPYCRNKIQHHAAIEILPHNKQEAQYIKDPVVVVVLNHLKTGEGSFLKGYKKRKPYVKPLRYQTQNSDDDLVFVDPSSTPHNTEETLQFETKNNLASYYAHLVCRH
ncbi:MAG: hypothetical protein V6Z78_04760 [Holosporaceae bacterium]